MLLIVCIIHAILRNNVKNWSYLSFKEFSELNNSDSDYSENNFTLQLKKENNDANAHSNSDKKLDQLKAKMELIYNLETLDYLTSLENCPKVKPCSKRLKELFVLRKKFQKQVLRSLGKVDKL
ncbi:MAG: hypothetical protein HKN40_06610 [Winogradskyella sp.]|uniref:hypothetical protein n=1 Tax=Winogradskyella sp. TaxID=1883156 RepID=UPI0017E00B83|nr:hypothetical protein [Winogradskyella sp.]